MNRGGMRDMLRRILMEDSADNWTDTELNEILNLALQSWQDYVLAVDPDAFLQWDYADLTVDERYYPKPVGMRSEVELGYKGDTSWTDYKPLELYGYQSLRRGIVGTRRESDTDPIPTEPSGKYAHAGDFFFLGWNPAATVSEGLEVSYVPHLTMAVDSDVPDLAIGLHYGVVVEAAIMALDETPEPTEKLEKKRDRLVNKIGLYYRKSQASGDHIHPSFGKQRY